MSTKKSAERMSPITRFILQVIGLFVLVWILFPLFYHSIFHVTLDHPEEEILEYHEYVRGLPRMDEPLDDNIRPMVWPE